MIETVLGSSALPSRLYDRALLLPPGRSAFIGSHSEISRLNLLGSNIVWVSPVPNPTEPNSSLSYYVHVGRTTDKKTRVTLALLTQILTEPAFDVLRTKEQLGYAIACTRWSLAGASDAGIRINIQSEKNPAYLEERVEVFLDHMKGVIEEMGVEVFREHKVALRVVKSIQFSDVVTACLHFS
jgi:insulysin